MDGKPMLKELWEDSILPDHRRMGQGWSANDRERRRCAEELLSQRSATNEEANYKLGVVSGSYKELWPTGGPKVIGNNIAGVRTGEWTWYFSNGKPEKKATYLKGKL